MHLRTRLRVNTLQEACSGAMQVRLRRDCAIKTGHLNRCPVHVEDDKAKGTYLFEPDTSMDDKHCYLIAQMVTVSDGLFDLFVEHRGAGLALQLPRGHKLCELKQIAVTEVRIPACAPTKCLATYIGMSRLSGTRPK